MWHRKDGGNGLHCQLCGAEDMEGVSCLQAVQGRELLRVEAV